MPADSNKIVNPYAYTQNRDLSWLRFKLRVLDEAADETVPLLERLKFIAIFTSNLDEFFMVRVGSLFDLSQISPEKIDIRTGMTPMQQLQKIYQTNGIKYVLIWIVFYPIRKVHFNPIFCFCLKQRSQF